jgi:hypothetical protein
MMQVIAPVRIETDKITEWQEATKVQGIFAAPVPSIIRDTYLIPKLTVQTLEGPQHLDYDGVLCTGLNKSDPWQMSRADLFNKYTVEGVTHDGWMSCVPIPGNTVKVYKPGVKYFQIECLSGTKIHPTGDPKVFIYIQSGGEEDYILQDKTNPAHVWIVNGAIFNQTHKIIKPDAATDTIQEN